AYSATLDVPEGTATLVTELLVAERLRRGTGVGARAASARDQAILVLVLRWFREDTGMRTLARDAGVSLATGYRYLHEGIDALAAQAPDLHEVLERGKAAGWTHVVLDGTLVTTDRCRTKNPDTGHDLWFSGKHKAHGGNVQIVCDPDGFPAAVSDVQPGSTHDLAAARRTGFLGTLYAAAALLGLPTLADKGYDGAGAGVLTPTKGSALHPDNTARNELTSCLRAPGERGIALLKTRWKALNRIRLCPQRIGAIAAAALVLTTAERPIR
nr:IS5/IS1182 family transposase [Actinomycetota bacterium]